MSNLGIEMDPLFSGYAILEFEPMWPKRFAAPHAFLNAGTAHTNHDFTDDRQDPL